MSKNSELKIIPNTFMKSITMKLVRDSHIEEISLIDWIVVLRKWNMPFFRQLYGVSAWEFFQHKGKCIITQPVNQKDNFPFTVEFRFCCGLHALLTTAYNCKLNVKIWFISQSWYGFNLAEVPWIDNSYLIDLHLAFINLNNHHNDTYFVNCIVWVDFRTKFGTWTRFVVL